MSTRIITVEELIEELEATEAPHARVWITVVDGEGDLVSEPLRNVRVECNVVRLEGGGV